VKYHLYMLGWTFLYTLRDPVSWLSLLALGLALWSLWR
jgi:hypothetical protein